MNVDNNTEISFKSTIAMVNGWTIVKLPSNASKKLPSRGQVMVKGTINHMAFTAPLEPDGTSGHWLNINSDLQKIAKLRPGDTASLEMTILKAWPEPLIPADWQKALNEDKEVYTLWKSLTPMARWEWLRWINSTDQPATRQRRIEVSCSKLLNGLRRPCCFNRSMCCVPSVSKNGVLLKPDSIKT